MLVCWSILLPSRLLSVEPESAFGRVQVFPQGFFLAHVVVFVMFGNMYIKSNVWRLDSREHYTGMCCIK